MLLVLQYSLPPTKSSASAALKREGAQPTQIAAETAAAWDQINPSYSDPAYICGHARPAGLCCHKLMAAS